MATNLPPASVAADMDRIFKPLTDSVTVPASPDAARPVAVRRRGWRAATLVAPALVLLAGGALGVGYVHYAEAPAPSAAIRRTAAAPSPPRRLERTEREAVVPTAVPDETVAPPLPETTRTAAPRAASASPAASAISASPRAAPRGRATERPVREDLRETTGAAACPPGSLEDQCIYQDVLDSDARLRRAYRRARQSGVSYGELSAINRQWNRAREAAQDDPDGTIRRYDRLTDMLDNARRDGAE